MRTRERADFAPLLRSEIAGLLLSLVGTSPLTRPHRRHQIDVLLLFRRRFFRLLLSFQRR